MRYVATVEGKSFVVEINRQGELLLDGRPYAVDLKGIDRLSLYSLLLDNASYEVLVEEREGKYYVLLRGELYEVVVEEELAHRLARIRRGWAPPGGEIAIRAPMPGLVIEVPVTEGQPVQENDVLVILESMKMENELRAPKDGVVQGIRVTPGQSVERDQILVTIK